MSWPTFCLYLAAIVAVFMLGVRIGAHQSVPPEVWRVDAITRYPWFSSAAKMEMINVARENHVDPQIIQEMIRRANYWEEPFTDLETQK